MLTAKLRRSTTTHEVKVTDRDRKGDAGSSFPRFISRKSFELFPKSVWGEAQGVPDSCVL